MLFDQGNIYTITSTKTLDEADKLASKAMHDFLKSRVGIDNKEQIMLLSLICDMEVCQVVDPLITARMKLRPNILNVQF